MKEGSFKKDILEVIHKNLDYEVLTIKEFFKEFKVYLNFDVNLESIDYTKFDSILDIDDFLRANCVNECWVYQIAADNDYYCIGFEPKKKLIILENSDYRKPKKMNTDVLKVICEEKDIFTLTINDCIKIIEVYSNKKFKKNETSNIDSLVVLDNFVKENTDFSDTSEMFYEFRDSKINNKLSSDLIELGAGGWFYGMTDKSKKLVFEYDY